MKKTSVYLTEEEAVQLRRLARATGRTQADLIRDGIEHVLGAVRERRFRSLGLGRGDGEPGQSWDAEELYSHVMGKED